jgi:hypothetical protein
MCADGCPVLQSQPDAATHRIGIAGVTAAGDIGGADKRKDGFIGGHPFSHITIEIDTQHTISFR